MIAYLKKRKMYQIAKELYSCEDAMKICRYVFNRGWENITFCKNYHEASISHVVGSYFTVRESHYDDDLDAYVDDYWEVIYYSELPDKVKEILELEFLAREKKCSYT